jgi:hypothetical protein
MLPYVCSDEQYLLDWAEAMNTFAWLVIGHFGGDWLFQNDWMARGKSQGVFARPGIVHYLVYTATVLTALGFSSHWNMKPGGVMIAGLLLFGTHWAIDSLDAANRWMRLLRQSNKEVVRLVVDQMLHMLVLVLLCTGGFISF